MRALFLKFEDADSARAFTVLTKEMTAAMPHEIAGIKKALKMTRTAKMRGR